MKSIISFLLRIKRLINGQQSLSKLRRRGLVHGERFSVMEGVNIDSHHCNIILIGDDVSLAPFSQILAHDASTKLFLNCTKISPVKIGNKVFVGSASVILPGVTIGNNVIIGAGSVVSKSLPDNGVYVGNPAKKVMDLDVFLDKRSNEMKKTKTFDEKYHLFNLNAERKKEMLSEIENKGYTFIE